MSGLNSESPRQRYFDAVLHRDVALLRGLLRADGPAKNNTAAASAFCRAAYEGYLELLDEFLRVGTYVDVRSGQDMTPLMSAAQRGHLETARYLIQRGANPSAQDHAGRNALFFAARLQSIELAALLLHHGVDPAAVDVEGYTAFDLAMQRPFRIPWLGAFGVVRRFRKTRMARYLSDAIASKARM